MSNLSFFYCFTCIIHIARSIIINITYMSYGTDVTIVTILIQAAKNGTTALFIIITTS